MTPCTRWVSSRRCWFSVLTQGAKRNSTAMTGIAAIRQSDSTSDVSST